MNTDLFQHIVGEAKTGEVATIRFFGKVTEQSTQCFNAEFDYLENCVRPKLIRVLINSEGGSVLHGMSTFSTIQNSSIETECINEGMCASMASIIWSAGTRSLMRDYAILMIHSPFIPEGKDEDASDLVLAFTNQLKTIYRKRFGLTKEKVEAIMDGKAGKDGTYFDAQGAVKAGIIPHGHVIRTSKQLCERVKNEVSNLESASDIQVAMEKIAAEISCTERENKHFEKNALIVDKNLNTMAKEEEKNLTAEYSAVAATLGLKEAEAGDVMARISKLVKVESALEQKEKELQDAQTVIAGKDATIANLETKQKEITDSLKIYQDKEAAERKEKTEALVEAAIQAGKIDGATKDNWLQMAEANFELTENTLNSIPAREQISKEIANDPENIKASADASKSTEKELQEKVSAVVGTDFEFKKMT